MTSEEAMCLLNNLRSVAEGKEDEAIDMAIDALKQTAWISVGERLPEPFEHVLVSLDSRYNRDVTYDCITKTFDGKLKWYDWGGYVLAWMPLPKPYKGGDANAD